MCQIRHVGADVDVRRLGRQRQAHLPPKNRSKGLCGREGAARAPASRGIVRSPNTRSSAPMAIQIDVQACIATPKLFGCLCAQMNQPHLCVVPPSTPSPRVGSVAAIGAAGRPGDAPPTIAARPRVASTRTDRSR